MQRVIPPPLVSVTTLHTGSSKQAEPEENPAERR